MSEKVEIFSSPSGIFTVKKTLTKRQAERLKRDWADQYRGRIEKYIADKRRTL